MGKMHFSGLAQPEQMGNRIFQGLLNLSKWEIEFLLLAQPEQMGNRIFYCLLNLSKWEIEFFGACST